MLQRVVELKTQHSNRYCFLLLHFYELPLIRDAFQETIALMKSMIFYNMVDIRYTSYLHFFFGSSSNLHGISYFFIMFNVAPCMLPFRC